MKLILGLILVCFFSNAQALNPSGTLPVLIINTENNTPVTDKENYISASYQIDAMGLDDVEEFEGNLQIRGRGNYTWDWFDKKPYRIKLEEKKPLLGFKKSKHFVLLAHADDDLGFLREPMGFKLSELAGLAWTPKQKPVELILNGDYRGLYFMVENIRIDKDRVNIFDMEEENPVTDVTGGWLCELDNYEESPSEQITIKEGNGDWIRITHHSPELINAEQEKFLKQQMVALDKAFYIQDINSKEYENLIDLKSLVAFYVLQELMDGQESFHGSCYFHRDRGQDKKWIMGPVWDFGNTYMRGEGKLIYENPDWGQTWIDQIVKFKSFQEAYKTRFKEFLDKEYSHIVDYVKEYAEYIAPAAAVDAKRWPKYANKDTNESAIKILSLLKGRISFLGNRWGIETNLSSGVYLRGDFNNWAAQSVMEFNAPVNGVYVYEGQDFSGRFKIADWDWDKHNWGTEIVNQDIPLDKPVELIFGGQSKDMMSPGNFKRVIFTVLEPGKRATVELSTNIAGVESIIAQNHCPVKINGREIFSNEGNFSVFDISGKCVGENVNSIFVAKGLYIVKYQGGTLKVNIK